MRWLLKSFSKLQEALDEDVDTEDVRPSTPSKSTLRSHQINDHVYEVHKPAGRPSVELVFFHGLQLEPGSTEDAHINTWVSHNKAEYWLTWLLDDIPDARILTISYDAAARETDSEGRVDMYVTSENLVHSLTGDSARVGQDGCPVVLVGHCLGGLVMKEVCSQAHHMIRLPNHNLKSVENFLANVKGLFFYATPHHGSLLAESNKYSLSGPLMKALRTLEVETSRRNEDFRQLRMSQGWKTFGVVGLLPVKLKLFEGIVVPEASARSDMDDFYAAAVDHYNICRPVNKQSSTYQLLVDFAHRFVRTREETNPNVILDFPTEGLGEEDPIWVSELSTLQLWVLRAVQFLLVSVHFFVIRPYIVLLVSSSELESFGHRSANAMTDKIHSFESNNQNGVFNPAEVLDVFQDTGKIGPRIYKNKMTLQAINFLSAIVTPLACVYLLRFYMTRRWAHPLELVSELLNRPLLVELWLTQRLATKDVMESESLLELGSRKDDDSKLEVEPLLLEKQLESEVEDEPSPLPGMQSETKIDVDPFSVEPFKQPRRLRSRGPNTNKVGPQSAL